MTWLDVYIQAGLDLLAAIVAALVCRAQPAMVPVLPGLADAGVARRADRPAVRCPSVGLPRPRPPVLSPDPAASLRR